jgi:tetratricopeptide (TPR) repeat protein
MRLNSIIFLSIFFLLLSACKSSKELTEKSNELEVKALSEPMKMQADRIFIDAVQEKILGNLQEAFNMFNQAIQINPQIDAAYFEMANIYLMQSDYEKATENIEKALEINSSSVYYREYYAELLGAQYKYEEAADVFKSLKSDDPEKMIYYLDEAHYRAKAEDYKTALEILNTIEEKVGFNEEVAIQKHQIFIKQSKLEEAAGELKKAIKAYPDEVRFKHMLADFYIVNGYEDEGVKVYEQIIENHPNDPIAITSLADYYKSKGDRAKYIAYYKMAFSNSSIPIDAKIMVLYNYIHHYDEVKNEIDDAFELATILKEVHPKNPKVYAITGDLYNLNENSEKALENYLKSIEIQKDVFSVWQQAFFILSEQKDYNKLIETTEEAMEYFPNQPLIYFFNGLSYHQLKDHSSAEKSYSKAAKMVLDNPPLKAQIYSNLGDVYNSLENFDASDESFEKALEIEPQNAYTLNNYSYFLSLRKEKLELAKEMSAKSNKLEPSNPSFLDTYAWILFQNEEYEEALQWQEKALKASAEPTGTLLEHYGDILFKLGRVDEAITYWNKAMNFEPEDSEVLSKKILDKQYYEE